MEEENKFTKEYGNATASECLELKSSLSDETHKERENTSTRRASYASETLTPSSAEFVSKSKFDNSSNKSSGDAAALTFSRFVNSNSDVATKKIIEFKRLLRKHKSSIYQPYTIDSDLPHIIPNKSSKQKKSSKSSKSAKSAQEYASKQNKQRPKVSNLQTLISNEETKEMGLFYCLIAEKDITSFQSGDSSSLNTTVISTKPRDKKKLSKPDRKQRSSKLNRKPKSPEFEKAKLKKIDQISKPLRKEANWLDIEVAQEATPHLVSQLVKSLQDMELSETNVTEERNLSENASSSIASGSNVLLSDESNKKIESYFGSLKQNKADSSPKESSDSGTLTPGSDDPESSQSPSNSVRSKVPDPSVRSKVPDPSVRSKVPDSSVRPKIRKQTSRSKLHDPSERTAFAKAHEESDVTAASLIQDSKGDIQHCMTDLRLKKYVLSRHPYLLDMQKSAKLVKTFMDQTAVLKQEYEYRTDIKITNSRDDESNASDWLRLLYYWDLVMKEVNMLIETIDVLYIPEENVLMTNEEFHDFMMILQCVFHDILELIATCQCAFIKYTKLCSSHDMYIFLSNVATFQLQVLSLFKRLKSEILQFTEYKKNENN